MTSSSASIPAAIPSVQEHAPGTPRFHVPGMAHAQWSEAAEAEAAGGIDAEVRAFFDAQLETGDLVLDFDPGFGFVALSATTAPNGMPTVMIAGVDDDRLQQLQDAAAEAGGWVEGIALDDPDFAAIIDARLEPAGRIFVHAAAEQVDAVCAALGSFIEAGRVLAICLSDAAVAPAWEAARAALASVGFSPCTLVANDDGMLVLPLVGTPQGAVIALPRALVEADAPTDASMPDDPEYDTSTTDASATHVSVTDVSVTDLPHADEIFPAPTVPLRASTIVANGFAFQSSHSRTGYGVAGANLLRALLARNIPVAYFPIGPVDASLTDNPQLRAALEAQGTFRNDMPSVRLSQQFDLAQHVGRGPKVGFTIFELDTFTARELHHLRSQDALVVCSDWARDICLQNGVSGIPIHVVPLGVDRRVFHEAVTPAKTFRETTFIQVGKLEPRKGQLDLLRAFEAAFTAKDAVRLILVCGNPFVSRERLDAMLKPFRTSPLASRITLLTNEMATQGEVASWMAAADCGVFAARAEGWNLEALEMLSMGRQVIATDYSAHRQFLNAENARLVHIDQLEPAFGGQAVGHWAAWGTAQHEQLVQALRDVHASRQQQGRTIHAAGVATATRFSWDSAADALVRALESLA